MSNYSLEHFRKNTFATTICNVEYKGNLNIEFVITYPDYFNVTILQFVNLLRTFENSLLPPQGYNPELLQIFTSFFTCLEQFTNTFYVMLHFYLEDYDLTNKSYVDFFKKDYIPRLNTIISMVTDDDLLFKKTGLLSKIRELTLVRNYIVHGNFGKLSINKTSFPRYPFSINYEDVMEELDIIINIIHCFRYTFPNIDLMPYVQIHIGSAIFFKKFDDVFYKVLVPYINNILDKHSFISTKTYRNSCFALPSIKSNIAKSIKFWEQLEHEKEYDYKMRDVKTNY